LATRAPFQRFTAATTSFLLLASRPSFIGTCVNKLAPWREQGEKSSLSLPTAPQQQNKAEKASLVAQTATRPPEGERAR